MHRRPGSQLSALPGSDLMMSHSVDTDSLTWRKTLLAIPLSETVFIAGGAATWLSERAIFGTDPDWTPTDIDIFICHHEDMFTTLVQALLRHHIDISGAHVVRRLGIVDVKMLSQPNLSFIRCDAKTNARDVVSQFDIDICTPIVKRDRLECLRCGDHHVDGSVVVTMTVDVEANIRNRFMHGNFKKKSQPISQYPLAKTMYRLSKYQTRGYNLVSFTFLSVMDMDYPDRECVLQADDFRTLVLMAMDAERLV